MILLLATPAEAHCYRIWRYPKPQRCFTALAPEPIRNRGQRVSVLHQHVSASASLPPERIGTLPSLDSFVPCPDGDERLRGIAFLRALGDVPASR